MVSAVGHDRSLRRRRRTLQNCQSLPHILVLLTSKQNTSISPNRRNLTPFDLPPLRDSALPTSFCRYIGHQRDISSREVRQRPSHNINLTAAIDCTHARRTCRSACCIVQRRRRLDSKAGFRAVRRLLGCSTLAASPYSISAAKDRFGSIGILKGQCHLTTICKPRQPGGRCSE